MRTRLLIGAVGIGLGLFGVFRLLTQVPLGNLFVLLIWLVAAVVLHDGVLSPIVVGVGVVVGKVPPRARRYLQFALIVGAAVTAVAVPLIARRGTQPAVKALLERNYAANLGIVLAVVAGVTLLAYVAGIVVGRTSTENGLPPGETHSDSTP